MNTIIKVRNSFFSFYRLISAILLTATFAIMLSGCYLLPEDVQAVAPPVVLKDPIVQSITTDKVRRGNIENKVKFWGYFMSPDQIELFFTGTGKLASVNVAYCDNVKAGEVLANLESENLDMQLAQLEISLQKAELLYNSLMEKNVINGGSLNYEVEDAKLSIDSIKLGIANTKDNLSKVSIISPADGIVTYINPLIPGTMIAGKTRFMTICDPKTMVIIVKESEVKEPLPVGKELTVSYNGKSYHGEVLKTPEDNINEENANFKSAYTIKVKGLDITLVRLNDTASIEYMVEKVDNVLMINKSNIRTDNGKCYVNVYKDGVIEEREVETGVVSDNGIDVEITKGLTDTDEILIP